VTAARKLPVGSVLARAFALPWSQGGRLLRVVWVPLALIAAISIFQILALLPGSQSIGGLWQLGYSLCVAWLAVGIHRYVLVDVRDVIAEPPAATARRVVLYAIAVTVIWALFVALVAALSIVYNKLLIGQAGESMQRLELLMEEMRGALVAIFVAAIAIAILAGRFCLLLPVISIDGRASTAIRAARGNTLRLTLVFSLLPCVFVLLSMGLIEESLIDESSTRIPRIGLSLLGVVFLVIEVAALSLAYRELISRAPPPTHPPA
jgi:hypothetical protein